MRISNNLIKAKNGHFYFTYTYPRWLRYLDPTLTISFRMSLKTKDLSKAQYLSIVFLLIIEKVKMGIRERYKMSDVSRVTIREILENYRDYISESGPIEQKNVCWGTPAFEEVVDFVILDKGR